MEKHSRLLRGTRNPGGRICFLKCFGLFSVVFVVVDGGGDFFSVVLTHSSA